MLTPESSAREQEYFDMGEANANLVGSFSGVFAAAGHVYYVPSHTGSVFSGQLSRVSVSNFAASGVETFDLTSIHDELRSFEGGMATDTHAYYCPGYNNMSPYYHGRLVRVLLSDFSLTGVEYIDLAGYSAPSGTLTLGGLAPNLGLCHPAR